jgi:HK97 family phage prohead protease
VGLCEIRGLELRDGEPDPETGAKRWEFVGHAAVFDSLSENLGGFREVIKRGAFKDVLGDDVRLLVNHDPNFPLARGAALELTEDPTGLKVRAQIREDLSYAKDLRINLEEGNVTQMSFAFGSNVEDDWDEDEDGRLVRTIKRFGSLFDVSPVTYPAYPATDAGFRAIQRLTRGEEVTDEEWAEVVALRSNSPTPDTEVRDGGATVQEPAEEVAVSEERAEVEVDDTGAGLSAVAASRRLSVLAKRERS